MSWRKILGISEHLGLSVRTTRDLIKDEVIPVSRLPSGTIIGNLDLIDETLFDLGNERAKQELEIDKIIEDLQ